MADLLATAAMLAHQGGWDEMLMVAAPILVFALILRTANRRAERRAAEIATREPSEAPDPGASGKDEVPKGSSER
jgi:hypothetical protein